MKYYLDGKEVTFEELLKIKSKLYCNYDGHCINRVLMVDKIEPDKMYFTILSF